ncbi:MAG: DUF11 domain-containing protein [Oscillospiraceae bacterium]|jgi:uncharacterized repeat protein (TIGR01451 family)|nr:DUF11 domain-containing protein [Oscillospiraceae bacterium]
MATISGYLLFDRNRTANPDGLPGITGVPVVLHNTGTGEQLAVLTGANGDFTFINVPNGNYLVIEAYGVTGAVPAPGDFTEAAPGSAPEAVTPPISFVSNPPPGTTNLDCLTPNTRILTVEGVNITNIYILNGPVRYTPIVNILDECVIITAGNLITAADNGTIGTFPAGTPANTSAPEEPYPGVTPDFEYVLTEPDIFVPMDGDYTVQNIMTFTESNLIGAWWRVADHTTGNETGRMMVVNGYDPGSVFFRAPVFVIPNTYYLFSSWILNMFKVNGYADPALGVQIYDSEGRIIFSEMLGALIPVNLNTPEWKEIGTVIYSGNNESLTIQFVSEGPAAIGNDYSIDDVSLREISVPIFVPVKSASVSSVPVGSTFTYTIRLTDICQFPLTDVAFSDIIPAGLSFVPGTVRINGTPEPGLNPNNGFSIPNVPGGTTLTITFDVLAEFIPAENPTLNTAEITYSYSPVSGGVPLIFNEESNAVQVRITGEPTERCRALVDIISSVALQEAALAHILNAEGEKIQRILTMAGLTTNEIIAVNRSVSRLAEVVLTLENVLQAKLRLIAPGLENC